ncbi:MAG: coproporphyrinogen dehydrogenase HemZ [Desulfotomaculaceae bacterium]
MIITVNAPDIYRPGIDDVIRVFYPGCIIQTGNPDTGANIKLHITVDVKQPCMQVQAQLKSAAGDSGHIEQSRLEPGANERNEARRLARLAVYRLLEQFTCGRPSPWGIMTGIRPTKVVHRLLEQGFNASEVKAKLADEFAVTPDKADLVISIALFQRHYLADGLGHSHRTGVYIGIPFCPSRCLYCSFPAYPRDKHRQWLAPFVSALLREIEAVGRALRDSPLSVSCVYIGGGTPTCLEPAQLNAVLESVNTHLRTTTTTEFTVEGGRPETLTAEITGICRAAGVDRLSINPQTMQDRTLRAIGRHHTVAEVILALERARATGFASVNMDVIAGLPGETVIDMRDTMDQIMELRPENLSLHTLAVKKASQLRWEVSKQPMPTAKETAAMMQEARHRAQMQGMLPYYMYRQKNTLGHQENIGYTLPEHECLYNIMIMEEKHTVIGIGAGAGSKFLRPDGVFVNQHNPKEPWLYIERLDKVIKKKETELAEAINKF